MRKVCLGEVSHVSSSKRIFAKQYVEKGIPFYRQKEIIELSKGNEISESLFISEEVYENIKLEYGVPQKNDLLITAVGVTLGIPYIVGDEVFYFKDGNLIWCKRFDESINSKYIYYWLKSEEGQKSIWSRTIGAAQPALTIDLVKQFELPIPTRKRQDKIVDVLISYDELIKNNQKQIKLLEEAAHRLYKEWFVDLHFPGYENLEIIDGVPEGWHIGSLAEIAEFKRGKTITKSQVEEGTIPVVAGGIEPAYYHSVANTKAPVITVSGSGANAGFSRLYHEDIFASDCSFVDIQKSDKIFYLYGFLKDNKAELDSLQKGAAQPHVYAKDINAMEMLIPTEELIVQFCEKTTGIYNMIKNLQRQCKLASEARDRLLPKLMSSEIEL